LRDMGYDKVSESLQKAESEGVQSASSVSEIGQSCGTIITMLRAADQVRSVYDELLQTTSPGTVFIDSSTVDPKTSKAVSELGASRSCHVIDAPVSGGVLKAANGQLTFMVGGDKTSFEKAMPFLNVMGAQVYHCGENPGSGQIAKICNNLILGITMNAVGEGLSLGVKLGMDPKVLSDIVGVSSGSCWSVCQYNPSPGVMPAVPGSNEYAGGFAVDLMLKDLRLAKEAAETVNQQLDFGDLAAGVYQGLSEDGFGGKDFGITYQRAKGALSSGNSYTA